MIHFYFNCPQLMSPPDSMGTTHSTECAECLHRRVVLWEGNYRRNPILAMSALVNILSDPVSK